MAKTPAMVRIKFFENTATRHPTKGSMRITIKAGTVVAFPANRAKEYVDAGQAEYEEKQPAKA